MSDKLTRCIRLVLRLQRRRRITNQQAQALNDCDAQTALRDLNTLRNMMETVPLHRHDLGPETYYTVPDDWRRNGLNFSMGDAMALHFGHQLISFLKGTQIPDWLEELHEKLEVDADHGTMTKQSILAERLVYVDQPHRSYEAHNEVFNDMLTALLEDRVLHATYRSRRGERFYDLWPLALVIYRRALYLLARDVEGNRILRLSVDRFVHLKRGGTFVWATRPDPRELVAQSYGIFDSGEEPRQVRLRFQPEVADLVTARHWHRTERFEDGPDGTLDLVMDTQGSELAALALEWGQQVEVIEPPELRQRVQDELARALARYGS